MKLRTKKIVDHYCGSALLVVLSIFVRLAGVLLRRDHRTQPVKSVLVMKFQGIGSLVIAKPALAELRVHHPDAQITFWGTPATCVMAREMPEFDDVITLNDQGIFQAFVSCIGNLFHIYRAVPDWAIDLEVYSKLSVVLCTLSCSRNRAGFAIDSVRLRRKNHTHLIFFNRQKYLGEAYRRLVGLLYQETSESCVLRPNTWVFSSDDISSVVLPAGTGYIVVNPNAGELSLERRWPLAGFNRLVQELLSRYPDLHVVVIGAGQAEVNYCRDLTSHPRVINAVGELSISELIQCINGARLIVSNDSAPLHIALLSDLPVVALFGPTCPQTYVNGGRAGAKVHFKDIYCSPCVHCWDTSPCGGRNYCMQMIAGEDVLESCIDLLNEEHRKEGVSDAASAITLGNDYYPGLIYAKCGKPE